VAPWGRSERLTLAQLAQVVHDGPCYTSVLPLRTLDLTTGPGVGRVLRRYSNRSDLVEQLREVAVILADGGKNVDDGECAQPRAGDLDIPKFEGCMKDV
jgi:hypothetical protein